MVPDAIVPAHPADTLRNELLDAGEQATSTLFGALRDGRISDDELELIVNELLAKAVDAVLPTGPIDPIDDPLIRAGVAGLYEVAVEALERDPSKMRERADRVRQRGNPDRAKRIEDRAARLEARRAARS